MNLTKSYEYFKPETCKDMIHVIGCGSVGSTLAENLVRCGLTDFTLWDFDVVEDKNLVNQMFRSCDIGKPKVEALKGIMTEINPELESTISVKDKGWNGENLSGIILMAVDNIETRKEIFKKIKYNPNCKVVMDFRTMLEGAQHYAVDMKNLDEKKNFEATMSFTHEEAMAETPVSACGITLGVATTVRLICALGVNNLINYVKGKPMKKMVLLNGFDMTLDAI